MLFTFDILLFYPLATIGLLFSSITCGYSCYRGIYNYSNSAWTFQDAHNESGNLYFLGTTCQTNGPCTVLPGGSVEIQYTQHAGYTYGTVKITDMSGNARSYTIQSAYMACPYIQHHGDTGAVGMNDPAKGDFSIVAGRWG